MTLNEIYKKNNLLFPATLGRADELALWKRRLHCWIDFKQIKLDYNKLLTYWEMEMAKKRPENCFNFAFVCVYKKWNKLQIKIMFTFPAH